MFHTRTEVFLDISLWEFDRVTIGELRPGDGIQSESEILSYVPNAALMILSVGVTFGNVPIELAARFSSLYSVYAVKVHPFLLPVERFYNDSAIAELRVV